MASSIGRDASERFGLLSVSEAAPDPTSVQEMNQRIPDVEILEHLGRGGMGVVYLGVADDGEVPVAVKVLAPGLASNVELRRRFQREAEILAALDHPGIVPLHRTGEANDQLYFVMEYIEGTTLAEQARGTPADTMRLGASLCDALAYAHSKGVVHRDVKPSNVMVESANGAARITDFGLAKVAPLPDATQLTSVDQAVGTMRYMAPEQWEGVEASPQSDLYSLGAILYERLTGSVPAGSFKPPSDVAKVPPAYDAPIMRALAADPAERFAEATEFRTALLGAIEPNGVSRRAWLTLLPLLLLSVFGVAFWALSQGKLGSANEPERIVGVQTNSFSGAPLALAMHEADALGTRALWADDALVVAGAPRSQNDPRGPLSGYAVVYRPIDNPAELKTGFQLEQLTVLQSPNPEPGDRFGCAVVHDGHKVVCGASGSREGKGMATIFVPVDPAQPAGAWKPRQRLLPAQAREPGRYGFAMALHRNLLCVTAPGHPKTGRGEVYLLSRDDADDNFGGAARKMEELFQPPSLPAGSEFGYSVACDGETLVVGCPLAGDPTRPASGGVCVYERAEHGRWALQTILIPKAAKGDDLYGSAVQVQDGWIVLSGSRNAEFPSPVVLFQKQVGVWTEVQSLTPALALLMTPDTLLLGGTFGVVDVLRRPSDRGDRVDWRAVERIKGDAPFGSSLALSRQHVLTGIRSGKGIFAVPLSTF